MVSVVKIPKLLAAARGQACQVNIPNVCNGDSETTVAAHSRLGRHGHGMGRKADDIFTAWACRACHDAIDGRLKTEYDREALDYFWTRGFERTLIELLKQGVLK
jgi:hypothetical protein